MEVEQMTDVNDISVTVNLFLYWKTSPGSSGSLLSTDGKLTIPVQFPTNWLGISNEK